MGMLLRRRYDTNDNLTTSADINKGKEEKVKDVTGTTESVKDVKPKTVKRGRPTKK